VPLDADITGPLIVGDDVELLTLVAGSYRLKATHEEP